VKFLKWFGITIGIIVVVLVLGLGYLGFIPGVSNLFGSNKAKNLGASYAAADYTSARTKVGTALSVLPASSDPAQSIKFSGSHPVNANFTQAEYNALLNEREWVNYPLDNVQLKINTDNTLEMSANVSVARLKNCLEALGADSDTMNQVANYLKLIPTDPAVYMKGKLEVENGSVVNSDMLTFKVGNLDLTSQIENNKSSIINGIDSAIDSVPGLTVKQFKVVSVNGQPAIHFEGTEPDCARTIAQ
jgi:hypothetical protein